MSFAHYQSVLARTDIPTGPKFLLCNLTLLLGDNGAVWPSYKWMAQSINASEKTVKRYLKTLTGMGLLTGFKRYRKTTVRHVNVVPHRGDNLTPSEGDNLTPQQSIDQSNNKYIFGCDVETGSAVETPRQVDQRGRSKIEQVKKSPPVDYDFLTPLLPVETLSKWKQFIRQRYGHWPTQDQVNFMVTQCVHAKRDGCSPADAVETQLGMGYPRLIWNRMKFHLFGKKTAPDLKEVVTGDCGAQNDYYTAGESIAW